MGLYIIGTSHTDKIDGPNSLNEVYARINPEVLLSELSEDDGRRLDEIREGLRVALRRYTDDEVAISRLDRAISPGFEYDCNRAYAKAKGVEHHMIGSDSATTIKLARLGIQNLLASLEEGSDAIDFNALASDVEQDCRDVGEDVRGSIAKCIGREKKLSGELMLLALGALGQIGRPDRFMEKKIREIYCPDKVTAFPVGFFHAMDCYSRFTLYSKLADLNPKRLFLHQA